MVTIPVFTLDTSCVSALANPENSSSDPTEVAAMDRIVDLAREGLASLQLTTSYERDFGRWTNETGRKERLEWLGQVPMLPPAPGLFRLDVSTLDGSDVLASDDEEPMDGQLRTILGPSLHDTSALMPDRVAKSFSDIDHLLAHWRSGADQFVTLDYKTILHKQTDLAAIGDTVCRPTEALPLIGVH
jgi:hypothetical protein